MADPFNAEDIARITTPCEFDDPRNFSKASIEAECAKKYADPKLFEQLQVQYENHERVTNKRPGAMGRMMSSIEIRDMYNNRHKKNWWDPDEPEAEVAAADAAENATESAAAAAPPPPEPPAQTADSPQPGPPK